MKRYLLKESGSWAVMLLAYSAGVLTSSGINLEAAAALIVLSLYINSKQAFALLARSATDRPKNLLIFLTQVFISTALLLFLLRGDAAKLLPFAAAPFVYIFLFRFAGEHALITEISGFSLLSLSSLISKFAVTEVLDNRLFIAVAIFFTAGVFKVRLRLKKKIFERLLMVMYLGFAVEVYHVMGLPLILLLPLIDNLIFSFFLYRANFSVTGWTEIAKGVLFLALLRLFY